MPSGDQVKDTAKGAVREGTDATDYLTTSEEVSARSQAERRELKRQQWEARQANFEAPQDLSPQTVGGSDANDKKGKDLDVTFVNIGQDVYIEVGPARVKIDHDMALRMQKVARRVSAATA